MKLPSIIATLLLAAVSAGAYAANDRSYYVTELSPQQKFDVYNDGRNTFLQSIPGLVVGGATADGEFFIVKGVPASIRGFMNGKPITIMRGTPPVPRPAAVEPHNVNAELKRLTDELAALSSKAAATAPGAAPAAAPAARAAVPATGAAAARTPLVLPAGTEPKILSASDVVVYQVTPAQHDLRTVIGHWARLVGWTSVWDIERDIPINMADAKENDFRSAVRRLLAATEFGDLPAKPCFYSNNVIRVVRKTTKCNPNE
ncbi:TcpQ domain-containing protein [Massilia sp. erpn]|uniref:TcpQ domain-containing protein n=1 Tax=Massilia sp. erpn TaxID=2738142 RepID=UPI0021074B44|nr:TcpQ domain-containing protein [Massilia sp. erpn]UTY55864.1 hypothetical protein HPQ68_00885 [Massilia sp. erpn]